MATRTPTINYALNGQRNAALVTWSGLLNGDDGAPFENADFVDRTAEVFGTFGVGGSVTLEGTNVASYVALTDPQGNAITKTAVGIEIVEEAPRFTRPRVTAGDGTTNLTVTLWCRRSR